MSKYYFFNTLICSSSVALGTTAVNSLQKVACIVWRLPAWCLRRSSSTKLEVVSPVFRHLHHRHLYLHQSLWTLREEKLALSSLNPSILIWVCAAGCIMPSVLLFLSTDGVEASDITNSHTTHTALKSPWDYCTIPFGRIHMTCPSHPWADYLGLVSLLPDTPEECRAEAAWQEHPLDKHDLMYLIISLKLVILGEHNDMLHRQLFSLLLFFSFSGCCCQITSHFLYR